MDSAVASSNEFSLKLLRICRNSTPEANLFYSPASITICLSMLKSGAKEDTLKQIEEILSIGEDQCKDDGFGVLSRYLQELEGPITLKISNILAVDQRFAIRPEFVNNLKLNYNSEMKELPFQSDPEMSRKEINRLIEEGTNGKIKDTFVPESISSDTRLVLANAIYFMGKWQSRFPRCATREAPFCTSNKEEAMVDMMCKTGCYKYIHSENLNADMIEVPYVGETVSLIILLPFERFGLSLLEKNISVQKLNHAIGQMHMESDVVLGLPKFKLEETYSLEKHLQNMGMTEAFIKGAANFSGISGEGNLYVSSAIHKTFLDINEEDTEAAAATAFGPMVLSALPRPRLRFIVDHPFMLLIRESSTGLILFLGSVKSL